MGACSCPSIEMGHDAHWRELLPAVVSLLENTSSEKRYGLQISDLHSRKALRRRAFSHASNLSQFLRDCNRAVRQIHRRAKPGRAKQVAGRNRTGQCQVRISDATIRACLPNRRVEVVSDERRSLVAPFVTHELDIGTGFNPCILWLSLSDFRYIRSNSRRES